jgi:hypothetical protein
MTHVTKEVHSRHVAGGPAGLEEDDDDDEEAGPGSRAQYVSANCVVFTHYSGDVATVVDEHFTRALSYTDNKSSSSAASQAKGKLLCHVTAQLHTSVVQLGAVALWTLYQLRWFVIVRLAQTYRKNV